MKKVLLSLISAAAISVVSVGAVSPAYASDAIAEGLCTAISADDRQRLRQILSNHNLRVRNIYDGIRCNGYSMLQFAITAEAEQVADMITRQLPVSTLEKDTVNGVSMLDWASTAGYENSAALAAVRARMTD